MQASLSIDATNKVAWRWPLPGNRGEMLQSRSKPEPKRRHFTVATGKDSIRGGDHSLLLTVH
jgi:hypothetical protein